MNSVSKYRARNEAIADHVIALSASYQPENLLARGMGFDHLRELLIRLARPILRQEASLAYAGHWKEEKDNLLYPLLDLVNAEQQDKGVGGHSTAHVGKLYNHLAWPYYLKITPRIEAQWINSCRIVRVTQQMAGIPASEIVADAEADDGTPRSLFNAAITLSAMRRMVMQGIQIKIADTPIETVPPVVARIVLGGKVDDYSGFMPGIFEEALHTMAEMRPLFILGGFGGAAEVLADAILAGGSAPPDALTLDWHAKKTPKLAKLLGDSKALTMPTGCKSPTDLFAEFFNRIQQARANLSVTLNTGLTDEETRELMRTRNVTDAVRLVGKGLREKGKLPPLAA